MAKSTVVARVLDRTRVECRIVAPGGAELVLTGAPTDLEPRAEGPLRDNRTLVTSGWAFALASHVAATSPNSHHRRSAEKHVAALHNHLVWIADLASDLSDTSVTGWCSACFGLHPHVRANRPFGHVPAYLCGECGAPTLHCAAPGCDHMALRTPGPIRVQRFCAEHRHDIPGFAKAGEKLASLSEYEEFLSYEQPNLARTAKMIGVAAVGLSFGALVAYISAAAIGGAIGTAVGGYTGAAASSYGLAQLGGGGLSAGGLGMVGGTMVISAVGAALGTGLGASVAHAYLQEDKSFHIEMLQDGDGVPVVVCNGFLTQKRKGWGGWKRIVTERYPDSPVYRIHWGAKELKDLGLVGGGAAQMAGVAFAQKIAARATLQGARKLGPLGPLLFAVDLAKNPWHVAKNRAEKTGVIVADLLARTNAESYVLIGHSLGARAMAIATETLGTKPDGPTVQAAHLLGAAMNAQVDGHVLTAAVDEAVHCYHSRHDLVLTHLYRAAEAGRPAAGCAGFTSPVRGVHNVDVSGVVRSHHEYVTHVHLV